MTSDFTTDWLGRPVPENEPPETVISWWEVDPHPNGCEGVLWERSWQKMLKYVGENLDLFLEQDVDLSEGIYMKFRVVSGTIEHYLEMEEEP